jgi:precorrin-8X/cobalt-precorrin-8 methylmutase
LIGSVPVPASYDYLRDPGEITRRSFALVRAEVDLSGLPEDLAAVAVRLVHACGLPEIVGRLAWNGPVAGAARSALAAGAPVLADCRMLAEGVTRRRLPADNEVLCTLQDPAVPELARRQATTRSAAAVELWRPRLDGAVVAIGNAPTALYRLLELLHEGAPRPAAILAFPVGFVGAAESKEALIEAGLDIPYLTMRGRQGGSALGAAAVNAVAAGEP